MSREVILFQDASIRPKDFALILTERDCALQIPALGDQCSALLWIITFYDE